MEQNEPVSAWLFNSIANKHADAMDNYPEPCVLPRALDDDESAKQLSSVLPVILEQNDYEQVYNDVWWYKLKQGTGVKGIFWDNSKLNGLGDMDYSSILTKFQTCMEDIGTALREVSGTTQKYKFTEIARAIRNMNKITYVGTISSGKLDISSVLPNKYADLTVDNFLLVPTKITTSVKVRQAAYGEYHTTSNSATINKTYDASTGILKASGYSVSVSDSTVEASASASVGAIKVYVVEGDIVDATS